MRLGSNAAALDCDCDAGRSGTLGVGKALYSGQQPAEWEMGLGEARMWLWLAVLRATQALPEGD